MSNIHLHSAIAKYIGAKATVTRVDEGVKISMSDYQGSTEEIIAEAIESITTNDDGSLTFTLPNGSEITTESLTGPRGNGITSIEKTGTSGLVDTYTITYDDDETETFEVTNGATGPAAGFGTVTATVDANHGTPAVTVTASGADTAKNFAFAFSNLQPAPYDDSTIQARMDSFTHLTEGSTTGDAELIDGRVGADGVTYNNIGGAIRGQITDVKSDLNSVANLSIFTMSNATYGYSINESGTVTSGATSAYTDYIPVDPETKYMFSGIMDSTAPVSSMNFRIHEYDSSKEWIKQGTYINVPKGLDPALYKSSTFTTSATTKYVRISLGIASAITDAKFVNKTEGGITAIDTVARGKFETIDSNTNDVEGLKKQSYIYEDVTSTFTVNTGQAYGTVGSHITTSTSQEYKNVRISKSANVAKVKFSTSYNPNISSYIQYVDDNDIIISREFEKGSYDVSSIYEYEPKFPAGATGMYVSAGWKTPSGFDNLLEIYEISDLTFSDLYEIANNKVERDYNEIVKSVNRIADGLTVPQQSIIGYKTAYKLGFRAMLCDLRFTSDGVPVLFHDDYLNQYSNIVYDSNGQLVPTTNPIYIDQTSYEDLLDYDFGLYKGAAYANTPILSLEDMLNLCKLLGCEVWLEMKVNPTTAQFDTVFGLISKYGMREKCYFAPQTLTQLSDLISYNPDVYINFHSNIASGETMTDEKVNAIVNATTDYNRYKNNITLSKTANITVAQVEALSDAGVGLMMGTMNTKNDVTTFYNRGVPYTCVTYALCTADVIAGKVLFETIQLN